MVDTKISALTGVISADLSDDDLFHVVDTSTSSNKKITAKELTIYNQRLASLSESMTHTLVCPPELHIPALADDDTWRFDASLSWYNETLTGTWLGEAANETAARAISDTTGAYYHNTTDGKFYKLSAGTGQTETFRGNTAAFPAAVGWVVEVDRVIGYDLTVEGCPMWVVFVNGSNNLLGNGTISNISATAASIRVGKNSGGWGLCEIHLAKDSSNLRWTTGSLEYKGLISERNGSKGKNAADGLAPIANNTVNAVSAHIYPDAPIDPATGQKVQTVMVHTDGGVTQLGWDGVNTDAAWDRTHPSGASYATSGCFLKDGRLAFIVGTFGSPIDVFVVDRLTADGAVALTDSVLTTTTGRTNAIQVASGTFSNLVATDKGFACSHSTLGLLEVELSDPKAVRIVNKDYNTGMMPQGTVLSVGCDKNSSSLSGAELVTNGTFDTDISGWTDASESGGSIAWNASGYLDLITGTTNANEGKAQQVVTTVAGKQYVMTFDVISGGGIIINGSATYEVGTGHTYYFTAVGSATAITVRNFSNISGTSSVDNVSVIEALPDHSVTGLGFKTTGTINRTAVASGATMTALSGFSPSDYPEQPYNSSLNVGTGAFVAKGAFKMAASAAQETIFERDSATTAQRFTLDVTSSGYLRFTVDDNTTVRTATGNRAVDDGVWHTFWAYYDGSGGVYIILDGDAHASATGSALLTMTNTSAVVRLGLTVSGSSPFTNGFLCSFSIGTSIPSAIQAKWADYVEKKLFQPDAEAFLAGASNTVLGVAYDAYRGETYAWQADYRNVMLGGKRIGELAGTFTKGGNVHDQLVVEG